MSYLFSLKEESTLSKREQLEEGLCVYRVISMCATSPRYPSTLFTCTRVNLCVCTLTADEDAALTPLVSRVAVKIKKPIKTKFRMPVFNWVALKPNQINGTVFNEIDDERILEVGVFSQLAKSISCLTAAIMQLIVCCLLEGPERGRVRGDV